MQRQGTFVKNAPQHQARHGRQDRSKKMASASRAQAATSRRRGARKGQRSGFVSKSNVEVKTIEHLPLVASVTKQAGSDTVGPSNSLVIISGLHGGNPGTAAAPNPGIQRGTGCDQLLGCYLKEAYPHSMKFEFDYSQFYSNPDGTTGVINSPSIEVIHGQIKNTSAKMGIATTPDITGGAQGSDSNVWLNDLYAAVRKELHQSEFNADHLSWPEKNRRVKILSRYKVTPKQSALQASATAAAPILTVPPNYEGQFKFPITNNKTKLHECGTQGQPQGAGPYWVPAELWVPFTLIMCDNIEPRKQLNVRWASKCYLTDN